MHETLIVTVSQSGPMFARRNRVGHPATPLDPRVRGDDGLMVLHPIRRSIAHTHSFIHPARSTDIATASPPPRQRVARPLCLSRFRSAWISVVSTRAPLAPI